MHTEAKFLGSDWLGKIVDSGIGLLHRTSRLHRLAGRDNPMLESALSPQSVTKNLASVPYFMTHGWYGTAGITDVPVA